MPRLRAAERTLTTLATSATSSQSYICRTCRQHALRRTLHTTSPLHAELSFFQRIRNTLYGSKESQDAERRREEAQRQKIEELKEQTPEERQQGQIVRDRKGNEYEVAALVDASVDGEYVPATEGKGLRHVGSEQWVRNRADGGEVYRGYMKPEKKLQPTDDQWKRLLHHTAVEVLALRQARRDPAQVCLPRKGQLGFRATRSTTINVKKGSAVLAFNENRKLDDVLWSIPETAQETTFNPLRRMPKSLHDASPRAQNWRASGGVAQPDDSWMTMPLNDPLIKFVILKRLTQLTGHRMRDSLVSPARTLSDLHAALKTKEKPTKLALTDEIAEIRREIPNVTVRSKRITSIDKHKAVGRWKVIEDELRARDLPVTGSRWSSGAKTRPGTLGEGPKRTKRRRRVKSVT